MKKYNQLILVIISVASVTLLLIYRHEYNRLRYVLEVFDFFGQPNECSFPEFLNNTSITQHDWGPIPVWTKLEDSYVYSAFLKTENDVEALIIHDDNKIAIQTCYLWFENNSKATIGKIKFTKIDSLNSNDNLALYKYYCHLNSVAEIPYAVSFVSKNRQTKDFKKIVLYPTNKKKHDLTTVCVLPNVAFSKANIVEFISYHKIIGVDSFIIYNNNMPHKFMHLLQGLSTKLGVEMISYPWNYPYSLTGETRKIIEEDCILRTRGISKNIAILDWTEFIVPKYHRSVPSMLNQYDAKDRTQRFTLKSLVFCTNNHDRREPAVLQSLYYDETKTPDSLSIYRSNSLDNDVIINTQEINTAVAAIHRYIPCTTHPAHSKREDAMSRFSADLRKSTLFKLYKYDRL
ncbi:uncharacterized protein CBL_04187 [Carabus blaptoides fortunei]